MKKQIFTTTLADLRKHDACICGYNKLVRHLQCAPFTDADRDRNSYIRHAHKGQINLLTILASNGVADCLWALRAVEHPERDKISRYIACDCAETVLHIYEGREGDKRPRRAIEVGRSFANGNATRGELAAAGDAAWAAAGAAAWAAAGDAAWAAAWDAAWAAAGDAAGAAAWDATSEAQSAIIRSYLAE